MRTLLLVVALGCAFVAEARPFRAMVTRTAETTPPLHFELGLRYQAFFAGRGSGLFSPEDYHQLAPSLRLGLLPGLELNAGVEFLLVVPPGSTGLTAYLGDVPIGLQWTFLQSRIFALGIWARGTVPTGPSHIDHIPPTLSDGTLDAEGTLIAELRLGREFRLMLNVGYLFHGSRERGGAPDFDVPDALRYDAAATFNLTDDLLLGVELTGRYYFDRRITPYWDDNANQLEVLPHLRLETIPHLVLEAAVGVALLPELQEIYLVRGLIGFTYEFDLGGPDEPERPRSRRRRGRK